MYRRFLVTLFVISSVLGCGNKEVVSPLQDDPITISIESISILRLFETSDPDMPFWDNDVIGENEMLPDVFFEIHTELGGISYRSDTLHNLEVLEEENFGFTPSLIFDVREPLVTIIFYDYDPVDPRFPQDFQRDDVIGRITLNLWNLFRPFNNGQQIIILDGVIFRLNVEFGV